MDPFYAGRDEYAPDARCIQYQTSAISDLDTHFPTSTEPQEIQNADHPMSQIGGELDSGYVAEISSKFRPGEVKFQFHTSVSAFTSSR